MLISSFNLSTRCLSVRSFAIIALVLSITLLTELYLASAHPEMDIFKGLGELHIPLSCSNAGKKAFSKLRQIKLRQFALNRTHLCPSFLSSVPFML